MDDTLTDAEIQLREAAAAGRRADLSGAEVRAEVVAALLPLHPVWLGGARVTGTFAPAFAEVTGPLRFEDCTFDNPPDLSWARLRFVAFSGCALPGLTAGNAVIDGDLMLRGSTASGSLDLTSVRVAGRLVLDDVRVRGLALDHAHVGGDLSARSAVFQGPVCLFRLRCAAGVTVDRSTFDAPGGIAIVADSIEVDGGFFARGCTVAGEVRMRHAKIVDALTFTGSTLDNPGEVALRLDRSTLAGGLFLGGGGTARGVVRARSAQVGRTLMLCDGDYDDVRFHAMTLDGTAVRAAGRRAARAGPRRGRARGAAGPAPA